MMGIVTRHGYSSKMACNTKWRLRHMLTCLLFVHA